MKVIFELLKILPLLALLVGATLLVGCGRQSDSDLTILNVSYDPTRELYKEYNEAFVQYWNEKTGQTVTVEMSHGGSGKQTLRVTNGLPASVVTLALAYDIDLIQKKGLINESWRDRLENHSSPYTSTIVFLVRKGNPKNIRDWDDLVRSDVSVITPHPKTSGGARWNYLAAWGYALQRELGDLKKVNDPSQAENVAKAHDKARQFVADLYQRVLALAEGARGSTITFVKDGQGDVLLAWENEAFLSINELGKGEMEIVIPSVSILAEPPVTVVDKIVDRKGTREVAEAYLQYLYSAEGQTIAAKNYYRPSNPKGVPAEFLERFKEVKLFTVNDVFGGWQEANQEHFVDGGTFDQIYRAAK